jgi:hypothetical protein
MPDLGPVTVGQPNLGSVTVFQPNRATLVSPNYKPKPNVALAEINDVSTSDVQDGYTLVYSSANNLFEMKSILSTITAIDGGAF